MISDKNSHVLLIDRDRVWLSRMAAALRQADFVVTAMNDYAPYHEHVHLTGPSPFNLVVFSCRRIGEHERLLIDQFLHNHETVLVLVADLPWHTMRHLFLTGVYDVTTKPSHPQQLLHIIHETLASIAVD